jgi:hypothetical protein
MARFDVSKSEPAHGANTNGAKGGVVLFMLSDEVDSVLERVAKRRGCDKSRVLIDAVMMLERSEG